MATQRKVTALFRRPGVELMLAMALFAVLPGCEWRPGAGATVPAATAPAGRTVEARLRRYECEERCWLEVELPDGSVVSGVCNAPMCIQWLDNGTRLPIALVGQRARITMRQDPVFIGTEEDRLEAEEFRSIRLLD